MFVVCLALILVFISLAYFRRKTNPLPPGPTRLPILGSVPFLTTRRGLFDWALDISVTRHRLATVGFGPKKLFVINDFDLAKELFNKEEFSGRSPQPFSLAHKFFNGKAQGIVNTEGKQWEAQRRFGLRTLKNFGYGKQSLEETINIEANEVIEKFLSKTGDFLMSGNFEIPIINILWQLVAGSRFTLDDPKGIELVHSISLMFRNYIKANFIPLKIVKAFPTFFEYLETVNSYDVQKDYIMKTINEHEQTLDEDNPRDFIDVYLTEIKKESQENLYNKEDLAVCMMDFFGAGTETSSNTLKWIVLYLTLHQDVQERCREEIVSVLGDSSCQVSDMPRLPYVQATISEVQRIAPVGSFSLLHKTVAATQVGDFSFPPGSAFLANLAFIMNDPSFFQQPECFNPDRMIGQDGRYEKNERIIPFGVGRRNCMGELLARNEVFLFTVNLVQKIRFLPPVDQPPPSPQHFHSSVTNSATDFYVKFQRV